MKFEITVEQLEDALIESLRYQLPTMLTEMGRLIIAADVLERLQNMLEARQ